MPQSTDVTANQNNFHAEHEASSAAVSKTQQPHLSAHEETVQTEEQKHNQDLNAAHATTHESALHHGKEESDRVKGQ